MKDIQTSLGDCGETEQYMHRLHMATGSYMCRYNPQLHG